MTAERPLYTCALFWVEKNKIKEIVFISGISLSKKLAKNSYHRLDSYYMFEVF